MNAPPGARLAKVAATLGRRAKRGKRRSRFIPSLWFLTDPARTPDPAAIIAALPSGALPRGSAVIYRAFGAHDRLDQALRLRRLTRARGLKLLIGADWRLAAAVGADGVHLPERSMRLVLALRRARPAWLITGAAHSAPAVIAGGRRRMDAVLVSAVFPSRSPSAGRPLGPVRFAALARRSKAAVIALGGVNDQTAARLGGSGAAGLAAIEGFARP